MTAVYNKEGDIVGFAMDGITKAQRRRKEGALFRLLFSIEKEQKEYEKQCKTFPLDYGKMPTTTKKIDRMNREAIDLRSKLGICTEEQLEEFKERMINPS